MHAFVADFMGNNVKNAVPGAMCLLGSTLCTWSAFAPLVFVFLVQTCIFVFWIAALLLAQTWQIVRNKTTNEMSNYRRLEYFVVGMAEGGGSTGEARPEGSSGSAVAYRAPSPGNKKEQQKGGGTRFRNPFDRGLFVNCAEFCTANSESIYYEMHQLPPTASPHRSEAPSKEVPRSVGPTEAIQKSIAVGEALPHATEVAHDVL